MIGGWLLVVGDWFFLKKRSAHGRGDGLYRQGTACSEAKVGGTTLPAMASVLPGTESQQGRSLQHNAILNGDFQIDRGHL